MDEANTKKDSSKDVVVGSLYLIGFVLLFWTILMPWLFLFAGSGAESHADLTKFMLYIPIAVGAVLFLISIKISRTFVVSAHRDWYNVYIHDPEQGLFAKVKNVPFLKFFYRVNKSILLLLLFSFIVFVPLVASAGFVQQTSVEGGFFETFFPQSSFPGAGFFTEQQVSPSAEFGLGVTPASPSETLQLIALISFLLILVNYLSKIRGWFPSPVVVVMKWFVIPVFVALVHMSQHFLRYGGSDVSLQATFNFGLLSAYVYLIFASVVIALAYHDVNNGVFKLFEMGKLGSDSSIAFLVLFEIFLVVVFIFVYYNMYHSNKAKQKSLAVSS